MKRFFTLKPRGLWIHTWMMTRVFRRVLRTSVKLRIFNATVVGRGNVPKSGPVLIACNHLSIADPVYLWGALRRNAVAIAKQELWKTPGLGQIMWLMGHIPVDRTSRDSGERTRVAGIANLKAGLLVIIFPEGTIPKDGKLKTFKGGVYDMALATGAPVIPVGVTGTELVKPHGTWKIYRRQPVILRFGEGMYAKDFTGPNAKAEFLTELRRRIAELSGQELSGE